LVTDYKFPLVGDALNMTPSPAHHDNTTQLTLTALLARDAPMGVTAGGEQAVSGSGALNADEDAGGLCAIPSNHRNQHCILLI